MFPFLPFLTLRECNCSHRKVRVFDEASPSGKYCISHHIPATIRIEILKYASEQSQDNAVKTQIINEVGNGFMNDQLENLHVATLPVHIDQNLVFSSIPPNIVKDSLNEVSNVNKDKLISVSIEHKAESFDEEAWIIAQNKQKPKFNADFNMSTEMEFAIGSSESIMQDENENEISAEKEKEKRTTIGHPNIEKIEKQVFHSSEILAEKEPNLKTDINLQELEINVNFLKTSLKKQEALPLETEETKLPLSSRCSSVSSTSSASAKHSKASSPRRTTLSPSSAKSSPRPQFPPPVVNTPPGIRAARARQRAFQPSQDMLELFGGVNEINDSRIDEKKNKNEFMNLSEPGPELIEPDTLNVVVTTPDDEQNSRKSKRTIRTKNDVEANHEHSPMPSKMQLSDPGPEITSENEEFEDAHQVEKKNKGHKIEIENEEDVKDGEKKLELINNIPSEELTNMAGIISEEINQKNVTSDKEINEKKIENMENEYTTSVEDEDEDDVEVVIEYDVFGRQIERKTTKRSNKKVKMREEYSIKAHEIVSQRGCNTQHQKQEQQQRGQQKYHEHAGSLNTSYSPSAARIGQQQQEHKILEKTVANDNNKVKKTSWNANNYDKYGREKPQQQRSTIASIIREPIENNREKNRTTNARDSSIKRIEGNSGQQLRNFGDQTKRKTSVSPRKSKESLTTDNGIKLNIQGERTSPKQNQGVDFGRSSINSVEQRNVGNGGFGGGGGAGGSLNMQNGTDDSGSNFGGGGAVPENIILIRKANVINDDEIFFADVLVEDGLITKISIEIPEPANCEVIDANGRWLLPAGIDVHTRFSKDASTIGNAFSNGTSAALAGGTTTIIETVCPRTGESLAAAIDRVRKVADGHAKCNYGISVVVSGTWNEQLRGQMTEVVCEKGVNNFLLDFSSDVGLFEALDHSRQLGAQCCLLPENAQIANLLHKHNRANDSTLAKLEVERVQRLCLFSQLVNAPFALLYAKASAQVNSVISTGRADGAHVITELPLKSLAFEYGKDPKSETDYALELLADSQLCTCVSNDMSDLLISSSKIQNSESSLRGVLAAVENRLSLLWQHAVIGSARLDPMRFVAVTSSNPAKTFNLFPKKGKISIGSDADLVLWDFESSRKLGNNTVKCTPTISICNGEIVYRDGRIINVNTKTKVTGAKFLNLTPHSPYLFSIIDLKEKTFNLAQLSLSARNNKKVNVGIASAAVGAPAFSRRTSLASSCASAATTGDAFLADNERKQSGASVGHHVTPTSGRPITSGMKNRNVQSTDPPKRSATKVIQPPGGPSTRFW